MASDGKTAPASAPASVVSAPGQAAGAAPAAAPKLTHAELRAKIKAAELAAIEAEAKALEAKKKAQAAAAPVELTREQHIRYFESHLNILPEHYLSLDHSRMHVVYFGLQSLDMLDALANFKSNPKKREGMIDWIYNLQVQPAPPKVADGEADYSRCGFRGSTIMGQPYDPTGAQGKGWHSPYDESNLAMTYTALTSLLILGDDLSRVNKKAVIGALRHLQDADGCFAPTLNGGERDMRFVYCACAISHLLKDWSGFDVDRSCRFILSAQAYDGAFGLAPNLEGHGGSTYVAVASLALMGRLPSHLTGAARAALLKWCVLSQGTCGYRGRPNKPEDCCYSFWIAATLQLLDATHLTAPTDNRNFNLKCQSKYGGFGKYPSSHPDVLHAHYGLAGLSLIGVDGLKPIDVAIGLTFDTLGAAHATPTGRGITAALAAASAAAMAAPTATTAAAGAATPAPVK